LDEALACLPKAAAQSADPPAKWNQLGGELLETGDLEEAIVCYRQAIRINAGSADAWTQLGLAFFQKGDAKGAMDSWQRALEIKPDQPSVQNNLAWVLATTPDASLRNGAKAVGLAEQAKELAGEGNPMVLHTLAAAYAETGRYGDAVATARRALELAVAQKNGDLTARLPAEIKLYEADKPMRDVPH
jgi:tetratricopeptide (TPR) repeat protein